MTTSKKNPKDAPATPPVDAPDPKMESGEHLTEEQANALLDRQTVSVGLLKNLMEQMSKAFEARIQQVEQDTAKKINEANAAVMETIKSYLEQFNAALSQHAQQPQQAIQTEEQAQKRQIMEMLQPYIEKTINKYLGIQKESPASDPAVIEFKRNTEMLNRLIYKKAATLTGKMVEKAMKAAMKDGDFVADEAVNLVQENISHEPIV